MSRACADGLAGLSRSRASRTAQSGAVGSSCQLCQRDRLRGSARPLSFFGAGSGFGGSPSDCTRRQNGVNTRRPRSSLLRMSAGAASRSPGKICESTPIALQAPLQLPWQRLDAAPARSRSRTPRRRRLSRASSAMTLAAGPLRSTSERASARKACLQRAQRLRQPPACRAAERPRRWRLQRVAFLVQHVEADHRRAGLWRRHAGQGDRTGADRRETRR